MKKKVLVVTNYTSLPGEPGYNRFRYLCDVLSENDIDTTLVTSTFNHYNKKQRKVDDKSYHRNEYNIEFIYENGYESNIGVQRIRSQKQFSKNLIKYLLKKGHIFDVIYVCVPSLEAAEVCRKFCKDKGIKFIIDIQDLWPEAMRMIIDIPFISKVIFYPMKKKADRIYGSADSIVAVSQTYLERALEVNNKARDNKAIFIGTNMSVFDEGAEKYLSEIDKGKDEFWITYVGTLGHSYDLLTAIKAIKQLEGSEYRCIKLIILGQGPLEDELKKYVEELNVNVEFKGYIEYGKMAAFLKSSDIGLNCIVGKSASSIINKVGDYFSAGIPVLNSSPSKEMRRLVEEYNTGINYEAGNIDDLVEKIKILYNDKNKVEKMKKNSRELAIEKFDRKHTYKEIVKVIQEN